MVALVFWIGCTHSGWTCCHRHCYEVFKMRKRYLAQYLNLKSWTVTGHHGDHMTFVLTCRRSKQRISFCRTFYPFIQHHDIDAVHRRTLRSPGCDTRLKQAGCYGLSGPEFTVAGQLCIQNVTHACLFAKCTTHLKPPPCGNTRALGQQCS